MATLSFSKLYFYYKTAFALHPHFDGMCQNVSAFSHPPQQAAPTGKPIFLRAVILGFMASLYWPRVTGRSHATCCFLSSVQCACVLLPPWVHGVGTPSWSSDQNSPLPLEGPHCDPWSYQANGHGKQSVAVTRGWGKYRAGHGSAFASLIAVMVA